MTATRKWTALAVLLIAAVFAASWFLLISPKRSEAADLRAQRVDQDAKNDSLRQQLEVLKAQAQDLPKQEAFLAQIRRQLPDNPALPALIRDLSAAARKAGVDLTTLAPEAPVSVVSTPVTAPTTAASPAAGPAADESATGTTGTAAAPAAPASVLFQVPITVKAQGSYFEMEQFINKIEGLKRSFLVSGFNLKEPDASAAPEGTDPGLELTIQGRVFLAPENLPATATAPGVVAPAPAATPAPSTAPAAN
jgi:Tfp pilus assembly protein PilO